MRRSILALIFIAGGWGTARADLSDVTVVAGADFAFKSLTLDIDRTRSSFSPTYVSLVPTLIVGYKSFYASASYDRSLGTDPGTNETDSGSGPTATTLDFSRTDSTFTLGYRWNRSFSLFAGYTKGLSKFTETSFASGTLIVTRTDYTESGPFIGVGYNKGFGDRGSLGLSIAYAELDGELDITIMPGAAKVVEKGDNTGFSFGANWSGPLAGSLGYRIGYKATQYKLKQPTEIVENYNSFFFGLVNYF